MGNSAPSQPLLNLPFTVVAIKAAAVGMDCFISSTADVLSLSPIAAFPLLPSRLIGTHTQPPIPHGGDHQP